MTNWLWIALTLVCVFGILFYIRKDHLRQIQDLQVQQQGQEMERRLQETAEQILARMEQEAVRLEALLARCEEQTQKMEPLQKKNMEKNELSIIKLGKTETLEEPNKEEPSNFAMALLQEELNLQTPSEEMQAGRHTQNIRSQTAPGGKRYEKVYELADSGLTMGEIAQQTGLGVAEVNLLLNLRK